MIWYKLAYVTLVYINGIFGAYITGSLELVWVANMLAIMIIAMPEESK